MAASRLGSHSSNVSCLSGQFIIASHLRKNLPLTGTGALTALVDSLRHWRARVCPWIERHFSTGDRSAEPLVTFGPQPRLGGVDPAYLLVGFDSFGVKFSHLVKQGPIVLGQFIILRDARTPNVGASRLPLV